LGQHAVPGRRKEIKKKCKIRRATSADFALRKEERKNEKDENESYY
jgi:uncharacterized protein Veg